jgi:hypothetical protein
MTSDRLHHPDRLRAGSRRRHFAIALGAALALSLPAAALSGQATDAPAELDQARFRDPPPAARPRVWWHWMDGNVSTAGIDKDLAWMKRIGIAGVQNFDGALHTPQLVAERVPFLGDAWRTAIRHAVDQANAAGLEFTIASSPGWSETGGPWVRPEQAMKKLVWSELDVRGGQPLSIRLPLPPATSGPFQDIPGGGAEPAQPTTAGLPTLYRDSRLVAYRMRTDDEAGSARITASSAIDTARLADGGRTHFQQLAMGPDRRGWIDFAYARATTMRAVELVLRPGQRIGPIYPSWPAGRIEASDDGRSYRRIADLPPRGAPQQTIAFPATTARHFRLVLEDRFAPFAVPAFAPPETPVTAHGVAHVAFLSEARVHRFEDKAGWSTVPGLGAIATPDVDRAAAVRADDVVDLTDRMQPDGTLHWTAPAGRWRILRMGWSLTGKLNNPASKEGTGLEVDKLNATHVKAYAAAYLGEYERAVGRDRIGAAGIRYMLNDSYEAMAANWTDDILAQFRRRRGYDPTPWLPVLTGRVVRDALDSDRFLWDFRRTLADLIADEHYGVLTAELHARGMGRYGESHEALRAFVGDGMEVKKTADVPMGATWAMPNPARLLPDLLESASVAHLYGQNVVEAESFTSFITPYGYDPARLKPYADKMMANGVNRFVIHTSAHQPTDAAGPGVTLGGAGQFFTRKETWAEMARPWIDYLARSSDLLQQGRFVADIAWFYGEDDNITALYDERPPVIPAGYAFDFVNGDALRSLLRMENGRLAAPGGARYRLLAIDPDARRMTLTTLRRLDALSRKGLAIAGPMPLASPSLADDQRAFAALARAIWARGDRVFPTVAAATAALGVAPDAVLGDPALAYVHRKLPDGDLYFVANLSEAEVRTTASFRVGSKAAQIWRADDASITPGSYAIAGGRTSVPLTLAPHDALFVVFRDAAKTTAYRAPVVAITPLVTLAGPWQVRFPPGGGAPPVAMFYTLGSWSQNAVPGIRYFSGTARYETSVDVPKMRAGKRLLLDLGAVANVAEVFVNGTSAGIAWKAPYHVDVTNHMRPGRSRIGIAVANLWPNSLIGDRRAGGTRPQTEAGYNPFTKDSPLMPSGLLGPVRLLVATTEPRAPAP